MRFLLTMCAFVATISPAFAQTSMGSPGTMSGLNGSAMKPKCAASDPVVWVNTRSNVFYTKGSKYYAKTAMGKFACLSKATAMGAHAPGKPGTSKSGMSRQPTMGSSTPLPNQSASPSP